MGDVLLTLFSCVSPFNYMEHDWDSDPVQICRKKPYGIVPSWTETIAW